MTTPLGAVLDASIRAGGPISVADYMAECLLHPVHGYYARREPFGMSGDFVTAPEISQLFGEIIGAWLVHAWRQAGRPSPFLLVEAGPGRGTLMADVLRTARIDPDFRASAKVTLIEASRRLRAVQRGTLEPLAPDTVWIDRIEDLPERPLFLIANEFFDALPIRQFTRTGNGWRERVIGLGANGALAYGVGPFRLPEADLPAAHEEAELGSVFEMSPAREAMMARIAGHLAAHGGLALVIDYGHLTSAIGDTFQAVREHAFVDPLAEPGLADLTSHVDFQALGRAARAGGATVMPPMTQGAFLLANGIAERAGRLGAGKPPESQHAIADAVARLCGGQDGQMGALFKVLCVAGPDMPRPLAPFDADRQGG